MFFSAIYHILKPKLFLLFIGFNPAKLMNARDFARRYMLVKMFMELDKDHNGFLDILGRKK